LAAAAQQGGAGFWTTMKCGNDVIITPDGGLTLVLLGAGLAGLAMIRRRLA